MDRDELTELIDGEVNEWREVAATAEKVAETLDQAKDALDAELTVEALEDALSEYRLIDYSGPAKEEDRLKLLDKIERELDEALSDARAAAEDDDDGETDEEYRKRAALTPGDHVIIDKPGDDYSEHGATLRSIEGDTGTVTLDDDTVPMEFDLSHLIPDPQGTAAAYLRSAVESITASNLTDARTQVAEALKRLA